MANVRYVGPDEAREVPLPDGQYVLPRLEWVDLPADAARSLAKQDDFELEATKKATKKAAKTRAESEKGVPTNS